MCVTFDTCRRAGSVRTTTCRVMLAATQTRSAPIDDAMIAVSTSLFMNTGRRVDSTLNEVILDYSPLIVANEKGDHNHHYKLR